MTDAHGALTRAHREEWARVVGALARRFGDLDIAEEGAAEAFAAAAERWPVDGVPPNPGAWLTLTATRKATDRIRRESSRDTRHREAQLVYDHPTDPLGVVDDDRLRLIFICCHPALAMEARVALTLRMVGGLSVPEIARAFLVQDTTMGARITRAKAKISAARIPYRVPEADDLPVRIAGVQTVLYLIFTEGHFATGAETSPIREELTGEAIRLARLLHSMLPEDAETTGLLALMLLSEARRPARLSPDGSLVPLHEQDRALWDAELVREGHALVRACLRHGRPPGRYQVLAAINAVHTDGDSPDWQQIIALYDRLAQLDPSPFVRLSQAIAVSHVSGPAAGLALLDTLTAPLSGYHGLHAARADLLRRLGRTAAPRDAFDAAIELAENSAEAAFLRRRRSDL